MTPSNSRLRPAPGCQTGLHCYPNTAHTRQQRTEGRAPCGDAGQFGGLADRRRQRAQRAQSFTPPGGAAAAVPSGCPGCAGCVAALRRSAATEGLQLRMPALACPPAALVKAPRNPGAPRFSTGDQAGPGASHAWRWVLAQAAAGVGGPAAACACACAGGPAAACSGPAAACAARAAPERCKAPWRAARVRRPSLLCLQCPAPRIDPPLHPSIPEGPPSTAAPRPGERPAAAAAHFRARAAVSCTS